MSLNPPQDYRKTTYTHRIGLSANKPAANNVLPGTLYFSTDLVILERSDGTTWVAYAPSGGGTGNVVGPASAVDNNVTLFSGATGKVIKDSGVAISSLATKPVSLVTDVTGVLPVANLPSIPDANLSANVALKNINNNFSAGQSITGNLVASAELRTGTVFYEQGRGVGLGIWIDVPFNAANFTTNTAAVWTIGTFVGMRYTLIGKTMIVSLALQSTNINAAASALLIKIPGGFTTPYYDFAPLSAYNGTTSITGMIQTIPGGTALYLVPDLVGSNWPVGVGMHQYATITIEIA